MRTRITFTLAFVCLVASASARAALVGTAFTYQGALKDNGVPASGLYDLQFALFYDPVNNVQAGVTLTANDVPVSGGVFTVTLDYGVGIIQTDLLYLQIAVRPGASAPEAPFTLLTPRQALRPTPFALALALPYSVFYANSVPLFSLTQAGTGNGISLLTTGAGFGLVSNISNASSSSSAVSAATNGTGAALQATNTGLGRAATLQITNASSAAHGVAVSTNGFGRALDVESSRADSSQDALQARSAGSGAGVQGYSTGTGPGVFGRATGGTAPALKGQGSGTSGTALELSNGAIRVAGAGLDTATPVFIHTADSDNSTPCDGTGCFCYLTRIDNPFTDGDPNAILIVTVNGQASSGHPIVERVTYTSGKWYIDTVFNEYFCHGQKFNVLVVKP